MKKLTKKQMDKMRRMENFEGVNEDFLGLSICEIEIENARMEIKMIFNVEENYGLRIIFDKGKLRMKVTSQEFRSFLEINTFNKVMELAEKDFHRIENMLD